MGGSEYRLVEICKGARERLLLEDHPPALIRPIEFPFPIPDRLSPKGRAKAKMAKLADTDTKPVQQQADRRGTTAVSARGRGR